MKSRTFTNRYLPLFIIILLNLVVLLIFGSVVIYRSFQLTPDIVAVNVTPPAPVIPPPQPPTVSAGESASLSDPTPIDVPAAKPPTVAPTTIPTDFKLNLPKVLDHTRIGPSLNSQMLGTQVGVNGGKGGTNISFYGSADNTTPGLIGDFYDLKQTPEGLPTPVAIVPPETADREAPDYMHLPATLAGLEVLRKYVVNWDQKILSSYYHSPKTLQTSQIFIPLQGANEATKAFGVAQKVVARRWVIHYHATVMPPSSGKFRFVGSGDDFLIVRVGHTNVLDAGLRNEWLDKNANAFPQELIPGPNGNKLLVGQWFSAQDGVPLPIDILIGEGPGGVSGYILLIEQMGDNSAPGDYPVFQVNPVPVPKLKKVISAFTGKTLVFPAQ